MAPRGQRDEHSSPLVDEVWARLRCSALLDSDSNSEVAAFYAKRSVFITGATGFIGKSLVEKLVRSCPDIKRIYLLIREKRGQAPHERLQHMIESQLFERIKSQPGGEQRLRDKLYAIGGDITMAKFGVGPAELELLSRDVCVVFNSAATIRFVEPIDVAVRNNIYSVGQMVEFCDQLQGLQALVHLSTAYSNCHKRDEIHEIFYEPPMRGEQIIGAVQALKQIQSGVHIFPDIAVGGAEGAKASCAAGPELSNGAGGQQRPRHVFYDEKSASGDDLLEQFARFALRQSNRPNTYTFTKAIAESYLLELVQRRPERYLNDKIPVAVVRPSIVGGCWREPLVGYVDNYNGPTGAILALYTGALQAMPGVGRRVADLVPVDMVSNMVIVAGWHLASGRHRAAGRQQVRADQGAHVFNMVSGHRNPVRWHQVTDQIADIAHRYPSGQLVRLPSARFIRAGPLYDLFDLCNHKAVAWAQDLVGGRLASGGARPGERPASALRGYARIRQMTDTLTPFVSNQWRLVDDNVRALHASLGPADRQLFEFDVKAIGSWPDYLANYILGSRVYTLKDAPANVPRALRRLRKKQTTYRVSLLILMVILFYYLFWA